ncbi:MAG: cell division protein ZapA [Calditrichaeota bacterium]|nr:cell division protein ZapA [Calditrichota bacterium]HQU72301.1 cell division protein ZapA [Calditrichia bacterium]
MERPTEPKSVHVQIGEVDLSLKTDEDPAYVQKLANYVDSIIQRISGGTNVKSQTKITLLAALQVANELFQAKKDKAVAEAALEAMRERSDSLARELDARLNEFGSVRK